MKKIINSNLVHVFAIVLFAIITIVYCWPITQGEKIDAHDYQQFLGMSKEIVDYRAETGEEALWTNSMFGGMPAYQISVHYTNNILVHIDKFLQLYLPRPVGAIFLYCLGFYILLLMLRVNPKIAILGALSFGLSSYCFIILQAGHNTKAFAIAYIAPCLASMIYCFRKGDKTLWHRIIGFFLAFLFLGLHIRANHFQVTYYLLFILFFFWIYYLVQSIKSKEKIKFTKNTMLFSMAGFMAIAINLGNIWSTYEYSKYSIRGEDGVSDEYATSYSYGKSETFNLLYPNFVGGASKPLSKNSHTYPELYKYNKALIKQFYLQYYSPGLQLDKIVKEETEKYTNLEVREWSKLKDLNPNIPPTINLFSTYFGAQGSTSGPVYLGAIVWLLFFIGLFTMKKPIKWVVLSLFIISILFAWGKHLPFLSNFLLDYFPLYNKFRVPSMILIIAQLVVPLLGFLGLHQMLYGNLTIRKKKKALFSSVSFFIFLGFIFLIFKNSLFDFTVGGLGVSFVDDALAKDRIVLFNWDVLRSTFFICLAAVIIYSIILMQSGNKFLSKIPKEIFIYGLLLFIIFDMWNINTRYLNSTHFGPIEDIEQPYDRTEYAQVDQALGQDTTVFRVFDQHQFSTTSTSFAGYQSVGGYHAAKLYNYQKLIENMSMKVLNMLNTKYIISPPPKDQKQCVLDTMLNALGNAWLVDNVKWVGSEDVALFSLSTPSFELRSHAIVDTIYKKHFNSLKLSQEDNIKLTSYSPNRLVYSSVSKDTVLAVFSEIFYPKGWQAYINGNKALHFPVNYALRGMVIPGGTHEVVFEFKPQSFHISSKVSFASSFLLVLTALMTVVGLFRIKK